MRFETRPLGRWTDPSRTGLVDEALYKALAKRMHPDADGGSQDLWDRLDAAVTLLGLRKNGGAGHDR